MRRLCPVICALAVFVPATAEAAQTAATAPTRVAKVGGANVGYRIVGHGRPLLLLMGVGGSIDAWPPSFVDALATGGHRVILVDNEGVGRTAVRKGQLSIRRMADTAAGLMGVLGIRRADVAGWSMGGMIAQSLTVRHPGLVRRLALLATAPGDGTFVAGDPAATATLTGGSDTLGLLGLLFPPGSDAAITAYVSDISSRKDFAPVAPAPVLQRQLAATGGWLSGSDPDGGRVRRLTQPVLVGGGRQDQLLPIGNQLSLVRAIKRAVLIAYPDAAHGFFIQRAAAFVPRLLAFLKP